MLEEWRKAFSCLVAVVSCCVCIFITSPALAFNVTDAFGNTCDTSQLVAYPHPPPLSVCPASVGLPPGGVTAFRDGTESARIFGPVFFPNGMPDYSWTTEKEGDYWYYWDPVEGTLQAFPLPSVGNLGGPVQFEMRGSDGTSGDAAVVATHSDGVRITDANGLVPSGSVAPGFNSVDSSAGFSLRVDGSPFFNLPKYHQVTFSLDGDYHFNTATFGTSALTPGLANAGSVKSDVYMLRGGVTYVTPEWYARGVVALGLSDSAVKNDVVAGGVAEGTTFGQAYGLQATAGKIISLGRSKQTGGLPLYLDVNGHYAYVSEHLNGFTDNSGFTLGAENISYSDIGSESRFIVAVPTGKLAWLPYVGATFDQRLGYNYTVDVPAQAGIPSDIITFSESNTFWGAEIGADLVGPGSTKFGVKAFYQTSADMHNLGATLTLKMPFYADSDPALKSGITVAKAK
jgi:hypothetical protein